MLPNLLGAAATLITVILLIVGLATEPGEGSSNSGSDRSGSSSRDNEQTDRETTSALQTNQPSPVQSTDAPKDPETHTPELSTTPTQRKGVSAPTRALPPRQRPTTTPPSAPQPTSTPQFTKPAPVPTPKEEDPALNDPDVPATAILGYDADGNRTATWIQDGFRYIKTYADDGTTLNKTNEGLRTKTVTTSKDGITYYTEYDELDNPLTTRSSGVYTPPRDPFEDFTPPPLPTVAKPGPTQTHAPEKHFTPQELQEEISRQFDEWNKYREDRGLNRGVWDPAVANEAQKWANKLAQLDNGSTKIYFQTPHERQYLLTVNDPTYPYVDLNTAENVWMTDKFNIHKTVQTFIDSPSHNRNLLLSEAGKPVRIGIGVAAGTSKDHNGRLPYYVVYKVGRYY